MYGCNFITVEHLQTLADNCPRLSVLDLGYAKFNPQFFEPISKVLTTHPGFPPFSSSTSPSPQIKDEPLLSLDSSR